MKELKTEYKAKKQEIRSKLEEFKRDKSPEQLFEELCFCLCTPMSKAETVIRAINPSTKNILLNGTEAELTSLLQKNTRFHITKAKRIIAARKNIIDISRLSADGQKARAFLVENVNGLGMKEASHFLRNIGYKDIAIIDGHILNSMQEFGIIRGNKRPKNCREYLALEKKFFKFANNIGIASEELDLLLWSRKTGKIIK